MSFGDDLKRDMQILVDTSLSSPEAHAYVARTAREILAKAEAEGFGHKFAQMVDGILDAPEETAQLNGGEIRYFFTNLTDAITFALGFLNQYSPRGKTGRFAAAWFLIVRGQPWSGAIKDIPRGSTVMISNYAPFARHIEVGWKNRRAGLYLTEKARSAVKKAFPGVTVERLFINIPFRPGSAIDGWPVPYIGRRGPVLYPAISISER